MAVMICGWEGNRRSGVAQAMHHRLSGVPTYGLNGLEKGDEHPAYALQCSTAFYLEKGSTLTSSQLSYSKFSSVIPQKMNPLAFRICQTCCCVIIPANAPNATDTSLSENNVSLNGILQFQHRGILYHNNSCWTIDTEYQSIINQSINQSINQPVSHPLSCLIAT